MIRVGLRGLPSYWNQALLSFRPVVVTQSTRKIFLAAMKSPQICCTARLSPANVVACARLQILCRGHATDKPSQADPEYTVIYRLPFIRALRSFSRVKIAQTAITLVAVPPLAMLCKEGLITKQAFGYSVSLAVLATVLLYAMSYYLRRIIGLMAVNKNCDTLRVSHLTFWGRRHNFSVPITDVQPLNEVGDQPGEVLKKFKTYSSDHTLFYTLNYGMIADREKFEMVFGKPA